MMMLSANVFSVGIGLLFILGPVLALPCLMVLAVTVRAGWYWTGWLVYFVLVAASCSVSAAADLERGVRTDAVIGPPLVLWIVPAVAICWMGRVSWLKRHFLALYWCSAATYFCLLTAGFIFGWNRQWFGH